jgi:Putative auto-transporter adhesin, head GIN domain
MKKTLLLAAALCTLAAPAALADTKSYKPKAFSRIETDGAMNVVFKTGAENTIRVETEGSDFSDVRLTNRGDTLVVSRNSIKEERSWFRGGTSISVSDDRKTVKVNGKKKPAYTVYVTGPELSAVNSAQSSTFRSETIAAPDFDANASSSASIWLGGSADTANLSASSSGSIDAAKLLAVELDVDASSSGDVIAAARGADEVTINASSAGGVTLASGGAARLIVDASSGASIELSGACDRLDATASSGASVKAGDLRCVSAVADASSGASVNAYASGAASGNASSGGSVNFAGSPREQDASKSSGGSVSFSN